MEEKEVLQNAVDAITDKPITIEIVLKHPNFFERLSSKITKKHAKRVFHLKPIVVGNIYRIASKVIQIPDDLLKNGVLDGIIKGGFHHMDKLVYIVAVGLENGKNEPGKQIISFIRNEFTTTDMQTVFDAIMIQFNVQDFLRSIILIKGANVLSVPETDANDAIIPG